MTTSIQKENVDPLASDFQQLSLENQKIGNEESKNVNQLTDQEFAKNSKGECLVIGNTKADLQKNFERFRKQRIEQIKYQKLLTQKAQVDKNDPIRMQALREKFIETAKKYYGTPYAKRYHSPGEPLYESPLFLDCCGLIRQIVFDMREDLGFTLSRWNQCYQVDTLPIDLEFEQMKPGDLIFYSATYFNEKMKKQKHDMVHVEIFIGGETGEQSIGARWQKGVVQLFQSYKFKSTAYYDIKFHYKSIDTWLQGICKSFCAEHPWIDAKKITWTPGKHSIFAQQQEEEEDMNAEGVEEPQEIVVEEKKE